MKKIVFIHDFLSACKQDIQGFTLAPQRQERASTLFSDHEKQRFIAAEIITTKLISHNFSTSDIEICGLVSQKPYLKNHPDICFSRSYCGGGLAVAIEDGAKIGIDCERIKQADEAVMKYFYTDREKAFVERSSNKDLAFTLIWTRKESYIKCIGTGLHAQWSVLDVTPRQIDWAHSPLSFEPDPVGDFYLNSYLIDNTLLSVCSQSNEGFPPIIQEWR